ncbi:helix-turn-helix domain-containing protein [Chromobacterium haemolyticum]|uniref:helix-turn-helix domain-containing protein n=1 Tax=Chromobacterium haemolyticum TaxID=394935 RepID=UPI0011321CA1|nr:helix-turn-helix transcriptional regulator [Chromobacterium haemolyticum]
MVENNDTPLAQNIRSRMEQTGKSIKDISDCLGVTYEMARRYTLATARPRQKKLERLAELLGTSLQELEYGTPQARKVTITKATQPPQAPSAPPKRSLSFKNPEEMARYMVNENPTALAELLRHLANQIDKK